MDKRVYSKEIPLDPFFDYQLFFIVEVFFTVKSRTKYIRLRQKTTQQHQRLIIRQSLEYFFMARRKDL